MFDKLSCVLCLENASTTDYQINLDSDEPQSLNARQTIQHHFKEELSMLSYFSTKLVCHQCWELVQTFHEFYLRVQSAHIAATNTLKSLQEIHINTTDIKVEPDALDELISPVKRRRGRPRRQKPLDDKASCEPIALRECRVRIEELAVPWTVASKDNAQEDNLKTFDIKDETLQEESMDAFYPPPASDVDSASISAILPEHIEGHKDVLAVNEPEKRKFRLRRKQKETRSMRKNKAPKLTDKTRNKTSDYDEIISQYFKLICCLCQKTLTDFKELKIHFRGQHQTNGYVMCCGKKLLKRGVLVDHIHFHNNPDYFKCHLCEKVMSDRRGLEMHIQCFHGSRERIYRCDICSKSFFRREVLARHYNTHAPEEQRKVQCSQCEKTFCNEYMMRQHLKLVHLNLYAKVCDVCGKAIRGREALRRHQEEHAGVPRALIKCDLCNAELTSKYGLARHMKTMHTEEYQTPQVCPICSKVSPSLQAHRNHFKYMHSIEKKHACKLCDKAFKRPNDLREHMTTHTGEVLYTCTFCPQTFNSNANMYAHRKRKHPKEWAEKCLKKNSLTGKGKQIQKELESIMETIENDEKNK